MYTVYSHEDDDYGWVPVSVNAPEDIARAAAEHEANCGLLVKVVPPLPIPVPGVSPTAKAIECPAFLDNTEPVIAQPIAYLWKVTTRGTECYDENEGFIIGYDDIQEYLWIGTEEAAAEQHGDNYETIARMEKLCEASLLSNLPA